MNTPDHDESRDWDLRLLRYFIEVVECESISRAAVNLGVTQPGLSRHMRQFEQTLGWSLFQRGPRSLKVTREGRIVAREGKAILKRARLGWTRMRQEIEGGEIRVGYAPSLGRELLQKAIGRFAERHPRVRLHLSDCDSAEMWQRLRDGRLDLVLEVATRDPDFTWQPLRRRRFVLAIPPQHPLGKRRKVRPEDLDQRRLLLLSRVDYPGYWDQVSRYFRDHKIDARVAGEFDGMESLAVGLDAGLGVALVAEGAALPAEIRLARLDPAPEPICVAVGWKKGQQLDGWTQDFVQELRHAAEVGED